MTQEQIIKEQLNLYGEVSRNWCLSQRITRLGAFINKLNKQGHDIKGRYVKTENGKDYIYYKPKQENLWNQKQKETKKYIKNIKVGKQVSISWD